MQATVSLSLALGAAKAEAQRGVPALLSIFLLRRGSHVG